MVSEFDKVNFMVSDHDKVIFIKDIKYGTFFNMFMMFDV